MAGGGPLARGPSANGSGRLLAVSSTISSSSSMSAIWRADSRARCRRRALCRSRSTRSASACFARASCSSRNSSSRSRSSKSVCSWTSRRCRCDVVDEVVEWTCDAESVGATKSVESLEIASVGTSARVGSISDSNLGMHQSTRGFSQWLSAGRNVGFRCQWPLSHVR